MTAGEVPSIRTPSPSATTAVNQRRFISRPPSFAHPVRPRARQGDRHGSDVIDPIATPNREPVGRWLLLLAEGLEQLVDLEHIHTHFAGLAALIRPDHA